MNEPTRKFSLAKRPRDYLGDAVYAETDGHFLWLTTENGIEIRNRIALESSVLQALVDYLRSPIDG
jgi:hypothetical protein